MIFFPMWLINVYAALDEALLKCLISCSVHARCWLLLTVSGDAAFYRYLEHFYIIYLLIIHLFQCIDVV